MWNKAKIANAKAHRVHARVALDALARVSNDSCVLTCVVEDFSATGARLRLEEDAAANLFGEGWHLSSTLIGNLPIEIRWRNVDHAGVSFAVGQDEKAQLNRFVKALIRYGVASQGFATEEDRGNSKTVPPRANISPKVRSISSGG